MIDGRLSRPSAIAIEPVERRHVRAAKELVAAGFRRAIAGPQATAPRAAPVAGGRAAA